MRYSKDHKVTSRNRIISCALKLFTNKGYDNVSIDEVMAEAELTRGAFYAHFKSKQELYSQAILSTKLNNKKDMPAPDEPKPYLKQMVSEYLDADYSNPDALPCPLAYLVTDVANREPEVRSAYAKNFDSLNSRIKHLLSANGATAQEEVILSITSIMVGSVAIARTMPGSKKTKLLNACKQTVFNLIDSC